MCLPLGFCHCLQGPESSGSSARFLPAPRGTFEGWLLLARLAWHRCLFALCRVSVFRASGSTPVSDNILVISDLVNIFRKNSNFSLNYNALVFIVCYYPYMWALTLEHSNMGLFAVICKQPKAYFTAEAHLFWLVLEWCSIWHTEGLTQTCWKSVPIVHIPSFGKVLLVLFL